MIARAIAVACLLMLSASVAVAQQPQQLDPNNAEHRFRTLSAYSGTAVRCDVGEATDETTAFTNFVASQKAAHTHVATLSRQRRYVAASSAARQGQMLEEAGCTTEKLPKDLATSQLAALDALKSKWK